MFAFRKNSHLSSSFDTICIFRSRFKKFPFLCTVFWRNLRFFRNSLTKLICFPSPPSHFSRDTLTTRFFDKVHTFSAQFHQYHVLFFEEIHVFCDFVSRHFLFTTIFWRAFCLRTFDKVGVSFTTLWRNFLFFAMFWGNRRFCGCLKKLVFLRIFDEIWAFYPRLFEDLHFFSLGFERIRVFLQSFGKIKDIFRKRLTKLIFFMVTIYKKFSIIFMSKLSNANPLNFRNRITAAPGIFGISHTETSGERGEWNTTSKNRLKKKEEAVSNLF